MGGGLVRFVIVIRTAPLVYDTWAVDAASETDAVHLALDEGVDPATVVTVLTDALPDAVSS